MERTASRRIFFPSRSLFAGRDAERTTERRIVGRSVVRASSALRSLRSLRSPRSPSELFNSFPRRSWQSRCALLFNSVSFFCAGENEAELCTLCNNKGTKRRENAVNNFAVGLFGRLNVVGLATRRPVGRESHAEIEGELPQPKIR